MNSTAILIAAAYGAVVVAGLVVAVLLAISTRSRRPTDPRRLAERERAWLFVVIAVLLALLFATIWFTPYGHGSTNGDVIVNVRAQQFAWTLKPSTVPAHKRIEFRLTSADVNHDFGIYDDRGHFVAQAQVMPGKVQILVHTFTRAGRYQILCLEFCGLGHALMQGSFEVTRS